VFTARCGLITYIKQITFSLGKVKESLGISKEHYIHSAWRGDLKSNTGTEVCASLANEDNVFLSLVDHIF
jgi:hypothetical protein